MRTPILVSLAFRPAVIAAAVAVSTLSMGLARAEDSVVREAFVQQLKQLDAATTPTAIDPSPALRGYALYPYLQAQQLRQPLRLAKPADDAAIAAFLQSQGDAPWTRELRRDWLLDLGKRQQWPLFLAYYLEPRADARLRCHRLSALAATAPEAPALRDDALRLWLSGAQQPEACLAPFDWIKSRGWLTPELLQQRALLALQAGNVELADAQLKALPPEAAPNLRRWLRLLRAPDEELGRAASELALAGPGAPAPTLEPQAVFAAFAKLARANPNGATVRYAALRDACVRGCALTPPASLPELRRELALGYALSRRSEAVAAYAGIDASLLDDSAYEWRIRSALWSRQWPQALAWIDALPPKLATQSRWRYWRARALGATGQPQAAQALYTALLPDNNYYAWLSAQQLGRGWVPQPKPAAPPNAPQMQQIGQLPGAQRTRELALIGRQDWAGVEWGETLAALNSTQWVQAAHLAASWGAWLQMVVAASKAQLFDDYELLYPRPYEREVADGSARSGVPAEWIYAVMRQESLYDPRARSGANAQGLLQMLPSTAREVARRNQLPQPSGEDLYNPAINVPLGAIHLRELLADYGGEFALVLGAYNAGPRPVERWRPAAPMDADIWTENVPYNETRAYIQRVQYHAAVFGWRASGKPQVSTRAVTPITPSPAAAPAVTR